MLLIYLSCTWIAGLILGSDLDVPLTLALTALVPVPLLFLARGHRKSIILLSLSLFVLFVAAAYSYSSLHTIDDTRLRFYNDRGTVEIKGIVDKDPDVTDRNTRLTLSTAGIKLAEGWQEVDGTALLFVPAYPAYAYGDMLLVTGKLQTPPRLDDFDYQGYLAHQGIYSTMLYPRIEIVERGQGSRLMARVYWLRDRLSRNLARVLPEPQASLAQGIILGQRGNIPAPLGTDFTRTGTAHLLAISGLNLSIIAGVMLSLGIWLFGRRRYLYIWLALGTVWLYSLLTGMNPPVVRGAIMASLFLSAEFLGRQRSAINALTLAAAVMAGISPHILGDASFQLSFLAMAGLVFLFPTLREWGRKAIKAKLGEDGPIVSAASVASDSLGATMAALIAVWPLIAYYFGIVSFIGPLATFLLLPALPGIIILGALSSALGFIALPAAQVIGWLAWLFLTYMITVVSGLSVLPLSAITVGRIDAALIWVYYTILAAAIWLSRNRNLSGLIPKARSLIKPGVIQSASFISGLPRKWVLPPLFLIATLVSFAAVAMPDDNLHVSFLDVGEGDATLIQKGSRQVLVDGGPSPQAIALELGRKMPFWDRTIDLLVLTHPHHDHLAGLVEVLHRFQVSQVLYPDSEYDSPVYTEWLKLIDEKGIERTTATAGQVIDLGEGASITVLSPQTPLLDTESDIDNNSVVLRLSSGDVSFLLAADIMREGEWELIQRRPGLTSTVLKVAHHGSETSTTPEFLAVVRPQAAVISAGADNRLGHPSREVVSRLEERLGAGNIYCTASHGTIDFTTDGKRLWVKTGSSTPAR